MGRLACYRYDCPYAVGTRGLREGCGLVRRPMRAHNPNCARNLEFLQHSHCLLCDRQVRIATHYHGYLLHGGLSGMEKYGSKLNELPAIINMF